MRKIGFAFLMGIISLPAFAVSVDLNEPTFIKAEKIEYDLKSETIKTTGKTEITNKSGQKMTLTDSYLTKNVKDLSGNDIQIWLGEHVYLESGNITRDGDITVARDATFTACKNCDSYGEAWEITSKKIKHNLDSRMLAFYNMVFWAYDFPVLWLPYLICQTRV